VRIVIIGAGGVGSAAARFLAKDDHEVTVLEQFRIDHDRGSSFGTSRIIRRVYPDALYTGLMNDAYPLWEALERDAGEQLLIRTGGLFFGPTGEAEMRKVRDALRAHEVDYEAMDAEETARRFPAFRLRPNETAIWQEDGGILRASACVRANLRLAASYGATITENLPVKSVDLHGKSPAVRLADGRLLTADRILVMAGPWMQALLHPFIRLPLHVTRQTYCHFAPKDDGAAFEIGAFPIWIDFGTNFYGFPRQDDAPGIKVAWHAQGRRVNPNEVDRGVRAGDREPLINYCAERLPGLSKRSVLEKVCLYTNTPDEDFIVDRLPDDPRVIYISGCSGHGFKFTVLLGRIGAWMATDHRIPYDLSRFHADRFHPTT
jgi:sarcosine oxidase